MTTITEEKAQNIKDLQTKMGPATKEEVKLFLEGADDEDLVGDGRKIATRRITTDTTRCYGNAIALLERATPDQMEHIPGVSLDMMRVAVFAAAEGDRLSKERQRQATKKTDDLSLLAEAAAAERTRVLARREILAEALRTLVGENKIWLARIAAAYGYCATADELTAALTNLVAVGRAVLADPAPGIVSRIAKHGITEDWLVRTETQTAAYAKAAQDASGTPSPTTISQADVDWWDGANLWLLEKIINVFAAGNMADPSIPKLVPISLRNWFSYARKPKTTDASDPGATGGNQGTGT